MPQISKKELDKLKKKFGVYAKLRQPLPNPPIAYSENWSVTRVIECAFREYVAKRRPTKELEELEWNRFRKILSRYL